uniref:Piezo TM1-24 domain-containing protein n=1 Tax=Romanomermis culicivorax TaxID=13658 RepID=A0A915JSX2_ROMCU
MEKAATNLRNNQRNRNEELNYQAKCSTNFIAKFAVVGCLIRQCLLSLLYGLLFLVWPFSSSYCATGDLRKNTKTYLKFCVALGSLALSSQLIVCGLSFGLWADSDPSDCDKFWTVLRAIGLQSSDDANFPLLRHSKLSTVEIIRYIAPDVAVSFVSTVTLLVYVCSKPRHIVLTQLDEVMASAVLMGLGPAIAQKQKALAERYRRHFRLFG